jgi:hypothetical protein
MVDYKALAENYKFINVNTDKQPVDKAGNKIPKWNTLNLVLFLGNKTIMI